MDEEAVRTDVALAEGLVEDVSRKMRTGRRR
jgi:hypothetical protein